MNREIVEAARAKASANWIVELSKAVHQGRKETSTASWRSSRSSPPTKRPKKGPAFDAHGARSSKRATERIKPHFPFLNLV